MRRKRWWRFFDLARLAGVLLGLWQLAQHPQAPRPARWVAFMVVAYALSPVDLIPDFIPWLGQLDELVIIPLGVALVIRLTPEAMWRQCLLQGRRRAQGLPRLVVGAFLVVAIWALLAAALAFFIVGQISAALSS